MAANRLFRWFRFGSQIAALVAAIFSCGRAPRVEAAVVSVSGTSTAGWTLNPTTGGVSNGTFTGTVPGLTGTWWGLYSRNNQIAEQTYSFASAMQAATGTNVLPVGGTVQIDLSLGFIDNGGSVGISLQNAAGVNRFETYYQGGSADNRFFLRDEFYYITGNDRLVSGPNTSFAASSWKSSPAQFQRIMFTQLEDRTYTLSFNGTDIDNSFRTVEQSDISQVRFFAFNAGPNSNQDQFANNLVVVPEPSTYAMMSTALAIGGWRVWRRRKRV